MTQVSGDMTSGEMTLGRLDRLPFWPMTVFKCHLSILCRDSPSWLGPHMTFKGTASSVDEKKIPLNQSHVNGSFSMPTSQQASKSANPFNPVSKSVSLSARQPTNKPLSQQISKSFSQSVSQPAPQSASQFKPICKSFRQSVSQSFSQPASPSVCQSASQTASLCMTNMVMHQVG